MAKKNFIVVIERPDEEFAANMEKHYPDSFRYTDTCYLLSDSSVSGKVADKLGLAFSKDADGRDVLPSYLGTVFRLGDGYSGLAEPSLWEWLNDHRQAHERG